MSKKMKKNTPLTKREVIKTEFGTIIAEGDALAGLACGKPASFPIIDAPTRQPLF
jgi:hypothetical protein